MSDRLRKAEYEQEKTKRVLQSIISILDDKKGVNENVAEVNNEELLDTLCEVLSSRLPQDFNSTTQNVKQIINIE